MADIGAAIYNGMTHYQQDEINYLPNDNASSHRQNNALGPTGQQLIQPNHQPLGTLPTMDNHLLLLNGPLSPVGNQPVITNSNHQDEYSFDSQEHARPQPYGEFRQERILTGYGESLRTIIDLLRENNVNQATIMRQNEELISLIRNRQGQNLNESVGSDALFFTPLVDEDVVINDPKWDSMKYRSNIQLLFNELTKDLASRSVYGDDVLKKSNVTQAARDKPRLNPQGLTKIKIILKNKFGDSLSELDFEKHWKDSLESLQKKCKNLRSQACMTMTSSQLAREDSRLNF